MSDVRNEEDGGDENNGIIVVDTAVRRHEEHGVLAGRWVLEVHPEITAQRGRRKRQRGNHRQCRQQVVQIRIHVAVVNFCTGK